MADVAATTAPIKNLSQGTLITGDISDLKKILRLYAIVVAVAVVPAALFMRWDWLNPSFQEATGFFPQYGLMFLKGTVNTLIVLAVSVFFGFLLAIPIGLVQVTGPWPLAWLARGFCTVIRGTPLLVQLWLFYYGIGEFLPLIPRDVWNSDILFGLSGITVKDILVSAWPFALLAFTLNFAGYEGEIMRGAFAGVPKGELEAAKAYGMPKGKMLRRVWLPRAIHQALPTLTGEVVLQLQSTPLVATVTIRGCLLRQYEGEAGSPHPLRAVDDAGSPLHGADGYRRAHFRPAGKAGADEALMSSCSRVGTPMIEDRIKTYEPELVAIRRDFHEHPELAFEEVRTSDVVAKKLTEWGFKVHRGLAKTGVVATLTNGGGNRSIGIRADMDALPIPEETGKAYTSKTAGKMHACGHDGHTTMLLGAARYLAETKNFSRHRAPDLPAGRRGHRRRAHHDGGGHLQDLPLRCRLRAPQRAGDASRQDSVSARAA